MANKNGEKGFKGTDKRHFGEKDTESWKKDEKSNSLNDKGKEKVEIGEQKRERHIPLPEMNFSTFVFSLNSSALFHLGEIPDPVTNKMEKNLPIVKQTIDIVGMLKEKTKGNLEKDEEALVDTILYDLRIRYVEAIKKTK